MVIVEDNMLNEHKVVLFNAIQHTAKKERISIERFESEIRDDKRDRDRKDNFVIIVKDTPLQYWIRPAGSSFDHFEIRKTLHAPGFPLEYWHDYVGIPFVKKWMGSDIDTRLAHERQKSIGLQELVEDLQSWCSVVVARYLRNEAIVDPWEQLNRARPYFSYRSFRQEDFETFTTEEKVEMRQSLLEFKRLVYQNYKTTKEQKEFIEERLDYLSNAVDRLNRFDWKSLAISTVVGIGINLAVDTQTGPILMRLLEQAFRSSGFLLR